MNAELVLASDGADRRSKVELTKSKVEMDSVEKAEFVEHGWVTVTRRSSKQKRLKTTVRNT